MAEHRDISLRTLAELEELHARVARLEGMWDKIKNAASAAKNTVMAKKSADDVAHDILNYAAKNNIGTARGLSGAQVTLKIHDEDVTATAQADGTVVVTKGSDRPSTCKDAAAAEKLLSQWQALLSAPAAADIRAYSAAVRLQQACRPSPRAALY